MKKTRLTPLLICLILSCLLLLCACAPEIVQSGGRVIHGDAQPTADIDDLHSDEDIVYITKSGTKYHKADCSSLSDSKIPVTLEQALAQGYEPCSKCFDVE